MKSSTNNLAMVNRPRVPIRLTHSLFGNSRLNKFFNKYVSSPSPTRSYTLREFERLQLRFCHDIGPMQINFKVIHCILVSLMFFSPGSVTLIAHSSAVTYFCIYSCEIIPSNNDWKQKMLYL